MVFFLRPLNGGQTTDSESAKGGRWLKPLMCLVFFRGFNPLRFHRRLVGWGSPLTPLKNPRGVVGVTTKRGQKGPFWGRLVGLLGPVLVTVVTIAVATTPPWNCGRGGEADYSRWHPSRKPGGVVGVTTAFGPLPENREGSCE